MPFGEMPRNLAPGSCRSHVLHVPRLQKPGRPRARFRASRAAPDADNNTISSGEIDVKALEEIMDRTSSVGGKDSASRELPVATAGVPTNASDSASARSVWADPDAVKAASVEFLAQAVFNFASCSIVSSAMNISGGGSPLMLAQVLAGHFALLFVLVGGTQPVSGGHFNPMISIVMAYWGALERQRLPMYLLAQFSGAAVGSTLQFQLLPAELRDAAHAGIQAVPSDHTLLQGFAGEFAAAFMLVVIVCTTALDRKGNPDRMPLVMALTVPLLIYTVGPVSSMCINPARAFGPAIASGFWEHHWIWCTAPVLGGLAAVVPYKLLSEREDADEPIV